LELYIYPLVGLKEKAECDSYRLWKRIQELRDEVNANPQYSLSFISSIDLEKLDSVDFQTDILSRVYEDNVSVM